MALIWLLSINLLWSELYIKAIILVHYHFYTINSLTRMPESQANSILIKKCVESVIYLTIIEGVSGVSALFFHHGKVSLLFL